MGSVSRPQYVGHPLLPSSATAKFAGRRYRAISWSMRSIILPEFPMTTAVLFTILLNALASLYGRHPACGKMPPPHCVPHAKTPGDVFVSKRVDTVLFVL